MMEENKQDYGLYKIGETIKQCPKRYSSEDSQKVSSKSCIYLINKGYV